MVVGEGGAGEGWMNVCIVVAKFYSSCGFIKFEGELVMTGLSLATAQKEVQPKSPKVIGQLKDLIPDRVGFKDSDQTSLVEFAVPTFSNKSAGVFTMPKKGGRCAYWISSVIIHMHKSCHSTALSRQNP